MFGSRRALRLIERNLYVYRHGWIVIVSGFFEPLFYLLSIGFGLGALVGNVPGPGGARDPVPAVHRAGAAGQLVDERRDLRGDVQLVLQAASYQKTFDAMLSTPLVVADIALGEIGWALIRGALYALGFLVVMVVLGHRRLAVVDLAVPAALLIGFAFGAVGMAATSFMRTWQDFDLIQLVILPLFLFSGTFYPIETYPEPTAAHRPADAALPGRRPAAVARGRRGRPERACSTSCICADGRSRAPSSCRGGSTSCCSSRVADAGPRPAAGPV